VISDPDDTKMTDEIATEYRTSLEDLTFNSKPVINMLTMVAEENIEHAEEITRVIQERIQKVHNRIQFSTNLASFESYHFS
jgi:pre-mRNA cleavage complex 2 protein Pcf11